MKYYKHVTLRSTSGNKINLPKEAWSKLGWKLNDKLKNDIWILMHLQMMQTQFVYI